MEYLSSEATVTPTKPVPFSPENSLFRLPNAKEKAKRNDAYTKEATDCIVLPAQFYSSGTLQSLTLEHGVDAFLAIEIDVSRLNQIHQHLWMVGQAGPGRPLHQHIVYGRKIACTEQTDLHLLWEDSRLFVKPCPDYLLSYGFWERHLCHKSELWGTAVGLLLSYTWLVQHRSDLRIAHAEGILPESITWERWTAFTASLAQTMEAEGVDNINPRFRYGNLRLSRVNWIYRISARSRTGHALINGFFNIYPSYTSFLARNTAPITVAAVYLALILTAMQVGLATHRLGESQTFQNVSLFATLLAIIGPLSILVVLVVFVMSYIFVWNLFRTMLQQRGWKVK
ncbi:hypothetical protein GLAREA_05713 [Glarea lozoyensis ATCC 20868]|uniref:Subtilisin-like serine protease n=1 Tax=Glarea lozoyensis (strain ATCC 20868 / MF5171) TaxID=1116229 RepID=S3DF53_GLAL2|nr:uncharacterized protein GLAREA_05713 [Glarea lozoyensis ATCC 20868]EPE36375.1 hypothetical protein GLAREA_05713 [Glarea lozoyensis ATCC 20868]